MKALHLLALGKGSDVSASKGVTFLKERCEHEKWRDPPQQGCSAELH